MEDKMLKICKEVVKAKIIPCENEDILCRDCIFNVCEDCKNYKTTSEIAQKYIKEHEKTVNTIEKIEDNHTYKIGDKVRVKSDLIPDIWYDSVLVNYSMAESRNEILTIEKIIGNKEYRVEENRWLWSEEMLEPVEEATITLKELQEIKKDNIIPTYYHQGNYDVIQFCNDNDIGFTTGNIIKYITRYKYKNGIEDLKKAKEYIRRSNGMEYEISLADLVHFSLENNLDYTQGKIIELMLDSEIAQAENVLNDLIEKEEKKIKEIEETYQADGMAD